MRKCSLWSEGPLGQMGASVGLPQGDLYLPPAGIGCMIPFPLTLSRALGGMCHRKVLCKYSSLICFPYYNKNLRHRNNVRQYKEMNKWSTVTIL